MALNRIAFDIETQADTSLLAEIPPPEVKHGRTQDPVKRSEKEREAKAKQLSKVALDPNYSRVVCISTAWHTNFDDAPRDVQTECLLRGRSNDADQDERELLIRFWRKLHMSGDPVVTFNGAGFDVPFLLRRSMLLQVCPVWLPVGKYDVVKPGAYHLDIMYVLHSFEIGGSSRDNPLGYKRDLHWYAKRLLGEDCPYDVVKAGIGEMYDAGDQDDRIVEVCNWDAKMTLLLAHAAALYYLRVPA